MSSYEHLLSQTVPLEDFKRQEAAQSDYDEWLKMEPDQIRPIHEALVEGYEPDVLEVLLSMELVPDFLYTTDLTIGEITRRVTAIMQTQMKARDEEGHRADFYIFPRAVCDQRGNAQSSIFILKTQDSLSKAAFWQEFNSILAQTNKSLASDLQRPILLYPSIMNTDSQDSVLFHEPLSMTAPYELGKVAQ